MMVNWSPHFAFFFNISSRIVIRQRTEGLAFFMGAEGKSTDKKANPIISPLYYDSLDAKRELYDRYGEEGVKAGGPPPSQSSRDPFSRPPRGYPAGGEGPGPFGGPGFGFGFGGFDFDFFGMPQHHRQFHGAFSSSSSSFPRHSRETRERMPYGEGNEWKSQKRQRQRDDYHQSVFGSNDDILQDIFSGGVISTCYFFLE